MKTVQDEYTFAGLMDYLVNQVAVMNVYAALFSVAGDMAHGRVEAALTQLQEVRTTTKKLSQNLNHKCIDRFLEVWPESHWPGFALRQANVFQSYTAW